jgi:hypothetical protein
MVRAVATKSKSVTCGEEKTAKGDMADTVLTALGRPKDLHRVRAHNVYDNRWRVDVFREIKQDTFRITDSFFIVADEDGFIANSTPAIAKKY